MSGLDQSRRWTVVPGDVPAERALAKELSLSPLVARVLVARGHASAEDARAFLDPSLERDWADPLEIPGMRAAADRVERAVRRGQIPRHTANSPLHGQPVRRVCRFAGALSDFAALPVSIYNLFTDLTRFVDNYAAV